ncbi:MAG: hypothetical protein JW910_22565 [Anaerolineae bacterium]|nr:hypothetical protein [Anaerolineae bacterium]
MVEYVALERKLRLNGAVQLQPLSDGQVDKYLPVALGEFGPLDLALEDQQLLKQKHVSAMSSGLL